MAKHNGDFKQNNGSNGQIDCTGDKKCQGNANTSAGEHVISLQKRLENMKQFAYAMAHDLKNPAISLTTLTRCLQKRHHDGFDENGRQLCEQLLHTAKHMHRLIDNINSYIATAEIPFRFEHIHLNEICAIMRYEFSKQLGTREILLTERGTERVLIADRPSVLRMLRNLIDNALKHGGKNVSIIEINCTESRDRHIISVGDNGGGFDQQESENIFVAFARHVGTENSKGTGLGLAIVREVAQRHGGNAWAESITGRGSVFYVSIFKNIVECSKTISN